MPNQPQRGGARPGAGRKAADGATDTVNITIKVRRDQKTKLATLGGSVFLRAAIDNFPQEKTMKYKYIVYGASNMIYGVFDTEEDARKCFDNECNDPENRGDTIQIDLNDEVICMSDPL